MAIIPTDCPHCGLSDASFSIFGQRHRSLESAPLHRSAKYDVSVGATCPRCRKPIGVVLRTTSEINTNDIDKYFQRLVIENIVVQSMGYNVLHVYPKPPEPRIPLHLPAITADAFAQAEDNFARKNIQAAIAMYGRALETGLKKQFPGVKGMLNERIKALADSHALPPAISEWSHHVRLVRNEALHDEEPMTEIDMIAAREFVDAVLRYVITLPREIEERRAATAPATIRANTS